MLKITQPRTIYGMKGSEGCIKRPSLPEEKEKTKAGWNISERCSLGNQMQRRHEKQHKASGRKIKHFYLIAV